MFNVYIIYSSKLDKYYIGQTKDLEDRLNRHNENRSKATKGGGLWTLVYTESFSTRGEAIKRELQIKKMKSRKYIAQLISKD